MRTLQLFVSPLFKAEPGVSSLCVCCSSGGEFVLLMKRARHSKLDLCPELLNLSVLTCTVFTDSLKS